MHTISSEKQQRMALMVMLAVALAGCASMEAPRATTHITVLHTNDHHGRFWRGKNAEYGLAARKTLIDQIRAEVARDGGHTLLLDAGDVNTGVPESDMQEAEPDFRGMSLIGYDAMAVGNHEFDKPPAVLARQRSQWSTFPWLSANIRSGGERMFAPYSFFHLGPVRLAVLGLTTTETATLVDRAHYPGLDFADPIAEARSLVPSLRRQADVVIGLTHMGHYPERRSGTGAPGDIELAEAVNGIDMIIGGHSQDAVCMAPSGRREAPHLPGTPCLPDRRNGAWIMQAAEWGKYVGRADFVYKGGRLELKSYRLIPVNARVDEAPAMLAMLAPFQQRGAQQLSAPLGRALGKFDGDRASVRYRPTNLGRLVATVMREAAGADLALISGGAIRDSLPEGELAWRDVLTALPFRNELVVARLTGAQLTSYLGAVGAIAPGAGGFAQISGAREIGAIDPARSYRLATTRFHAGGGDGYPLLAGAAPTGVFLSEAVRDYVLRRRVIDAADFAN